MEPIIQNLIVSAFFTKEEPAKVFEQPLRPIDYRALEFCLRQGRALALASRTLPPG
jgi:hypothetical protein